ncbi:ganglioside-induced differentiation-associated protein 1-like 1 isoform 1-T1 [Salvelinus alpinus]|uniref:Ganglioside-induced differentiation-associated protein 1-like 1 isoform X2 n=1 Tax=Salvelinus namaycush TaxID=8040 RepID=A0A8U1ESM7_SALNM|nr:ganglioside-induced differentiation-associated protein 1-like 1 [Salvelinus alpinus]XP_038863505.1 ganglioside-induced differentiation-associated protein 1-like 1 isoform X2 [Salvelinus namaycush]XP_055747611.1 ganglioside-induced differentiation-associated protein 1-like 1 [Salvelinus fontinalis]
MASSNNVTPTNCSWWPISALDEDGEMTDGEKSEEPAIESKPNFSKDKLVLYHWTQSFISQKVRLVINEKGLLCEERDVSLPIAEHNEPWFMRLNLGEEVPVFIHGDTIVSDYNQIIEYLEANFGGETVAQLIPDAGSPVHECVQQYRKLLDGLPMDAYTHGCILHPELTTDSMIPKYATAEIRRHLANAASELMKLDHEEPTLTEPYLSKQKKLMAKILDHDNVTYLKKILGELAMVLDQVEAELEKRKIEYEGQKCELWLCGPEFTLADVCLGALLHRLKFLGLSKKYWEDGSRPNLQSFFERVQKRYAFRKVLGDIHTTLLSAVLPNAFRMVKKKPPSFFGASFLMGSLGGMGYFAYWFLKKKYV